MKKLAALTAFVFYFSAIPAFAVKVTSLYQADLPVTSQTPDDRTVAVHHGFMQLLVRLTGDPDIEKNPVIKEAIKRADYYVQEFSYSSPTMSAATYSLHVVYDTSDVKRLLRQAGVNYWGERRPLILVWLAVANPKNGTEIIGNETPGDVLDAMKEQGQKFGLPLIFPLMDVMDMNQVTVQEVSGMALPILREAGKRYSPNAYLIGNIVPKGEGYESQWQLILNKNHWNWSVVDKTTEAVVATVLYQASQALAKYYERKS